ncbi:MAG: hypothetical protein ACFFCS_27810 [Candidatus Hodarchaeota archaeon]
MSKRNAKMSNEIDYKLELNRELKRRLRFLIKELELLKNNDKHVEEILGEIVYIGSTCKDPKTKAYVLRKLKELELEFPDFFKHH